MENSELLTNLHSDHEDWQFQINNYKELLGTMNNSLGHIVSRHSPREVPALAEHFQNQFIRQKEVLDIMRHDFKQHENKIEALMKMPDAIVIDQLMKNHLMEKDRLKEFGKIFNDLKSEFSIFAESEIFQS